MAPYKQIDLDASRHKIGLIIVILAKALKDYL
jgi:hypothetical protein